MRYFKSEEENVRNEKGLLQAETWNIYQGIYLPTYSHKECKTFSISRICMHIKKNNCRVT